MRIVTQWHLQFEFISTVRTGRFLHDSVTNAQSLAEEATESKGGHFAKLK